MNKFKFLLLATVLTIYGCGESNVDRVKKTIWNYDDTMTLGTAAAGSKECSKVIWKDESTKDQKFVSLTCQLSQSGIDAIFEQRLKKYEKHKTRLEGRMDESLKKIQEHKTENSPEIDKNKLAVFASNNCKVKNKGRIGNSDEYSYDITCDMETFVKEFHMAKTIKDEFERANIFNFIGNTNLNTEVCDYGGKAFWNKGVGCKKAPIKPQSMTKKISFVITADNSVRLSKRTEWENEKEVGTYDAYVGEATFGVFYKR